jgi:hypothetical protein
MKKILFFTIFIFSLILNLAVAATLGWHFFGNKHRPLDMQATESSLTDDDFKLIGRCCMQNGPPKMVMDLRQKIIEKKVEVLELLAKNPGEPGVAEKKLGELTALSGQMEGEAAKRISKVKAALPVEKRDAFLNFLKNRTAMGFGPGMHRGPCRCADPAQIDSNQK